MTIIALNPFYRVGQGSECKDDWTASPPCNGLLSNRNWLILGVSHQIKEGSFTTSFKLILSAPGFSFSKDVPYLGGVDPRSGQPGSLTVMRNNG
jgi:hypothetical protein